MANEEHLAILRQGVAVWNEWRARNQNVKPDLRGAYLRRADLREANLAWANMRDTDIHGGYLSLANLTQADLRSANLQSAHLQGAILCGANLNKAVLRNANLSEADLNTANLSYGDFRKANLSKANLSNTNLNGANLHIANLNQVRLNDSKLMRANLYGTDLSGADMSRTQLLEANLGRANLSEANLHEANLSEANLRVANLTRANLQKVNLFGASLVGTNFSEANLSGSTIYGVSVWDAKLEGTIQKDLVILMGRQPAVILDNIEVAQFVYMLIRNEKIRDVIDTITGKAVLILGRFSLERKIILDAIREELRKRNYIPILFDFEKPANRDLTETMSTLAHLARFIVADLTDAKSIPLELKAVVPNLPSVAVQPIILRGQRPFSMYEHIERFQSVLAIYEYDTQEQVIAELVDKIIVPAEEKVKELRPKPLG